MLDIINELRNETQAEAEKGHVEAMQWAEEVGIPASLSIYTELDEETCNLVDEAVGLALATVDGIRLGGGVSGTELITRLRLLFSNVAQRAVNIYAG
jgi:hypothetical protein